MALHIIDQMQFAQSHFVEAMNSLNHDDSLSFSDKAELVAAYKTVYPLWPHNILQLQDSLDRLNPTYAGRTRLNTCGEVFWVIKGDWQNMANGITFREDSYLHVKTQITHVLGYAFDNTQNLGTIMLNDDFVFFGAVYTYHELPERGVNQLLVKVDALPF